MGKFPKSFESLCLFLHVANSSLPDEVTDVLSVSGSIHVKDNVRTYGLNIKGLKEHL